MSPFSSSLEVIYAMFDAFSFMGKSCNSQRALEDGVSEKVYVYFLKKAPSFTLLHVFSGNRDLRCRSKVLHTGIRGTKTRRFQHYNIHSQSYNTWLCSLLERVCEGMNAHRLKQPWELKFMFSVIFKTQASYHLLANLKGNSFWVWSIREQEYSLN